jgi:hypothetical protein
MALSRLPTELVEQIASYLDLPDSRSLRLTNPTLNKQTSHIFKDRFLYQHTLQWTQEAFCRLVDMTSHPHFGNALHHLIIDATPRHTVHLWQAEQHIAETRRVSTRYGAASATRDLEEQYRADHRVAEEVAKFFSETRFDRKSLQTVFERQQHLDSITFAYNGMHEKYAIFDGRYCESSQQEMSRPFVSTMSALAASKVQIRRIQVDNDRPFGAVSIGKLEAIAPSLHYFDHAFERLETLHLHLRDFRYSVLGFEIDDPPAAFVVRFLAKARNVRRLELSCYSRWDVDVFGQMARHCRFDKLEVCKLSVVQVMSVEHLLLLLKPADKTLVQLSLAWVAFSDPFVSCQDFLGRMAVEAEVLPCVENLYLENLTDYASCRVWMNGLQAQSFGGHGWRGRLADALDQYETKVTKVSWHEGAVRYPFVGLRV